MRVSVDASKCQGRGYCGRLAPEVFDNDEDGYAMVKITGEIPAEYEASARAAENACPEFAIQLHED